MRSIAISTIFFILIGVSLFFFAIYMFSKIQSSSEKSYCYSLLTTKNANIDEKCKKYFTNIEKVNLNLPLEETEKAIGFYIAKCWLKGNRGYSTQTISCYSIEITNESLYDKSLNFDNIISYLKEVSDVDISKIAPFRDFSKEKIGDYRTIIIIYSESYIIIW